MLEEDAFISALASLGGKLTIATSLRLTTASLMTCRVTTAVELFWSIGGTLSVGLKIAYSKSVSTEFSVAATKGRS
jgi:hypothetical protein